KYRPIKSGNGNATCGNTLYCLDLFGHYPWVAEHHPDEALIMVHGLGEVFPSLIAARPASYPAEDTYDYLAWNRGRDIIRFGTVKGVKYGTKPSFTAQMCENGWGLLGVTADSIAEKSFEEAAA